MQKEDPAKKINTVLNENICKQINEIFEEKNLKFNQNDFEAVKYGDKFRILANKDKSILLKLNEKYDSISMSSCNECDSTYKKIKCTIVESLYDEFGFYNTDIENVLVFGELKDIKGKEDDDIDFDKYENLDDFPDINEENCEDGCSVLKWGKYKVTLCGENYSTIFVSKGKKILYCFTCDGERFSEGNDYSASICDENLIIYRPSYGGMLLIFSEK
jgi:hypothetical protein